MITRRTLLTSAIASTIVGTARADEPFPVKTKEPREVDYKYRMRQMEFDTAEPAGSIVVDPRGKFLYFVLGGGQAIRYGVSVGKGAKAWSGEVIIKKLAEWPKWTPSPYHIEQIPKLAKWLPGGMPGGPDNPLGARAMYLYKGDVDTVNRIHGAAKPKEIGSAKTAGCIAMLNVDIIDLYARVQVGTRVVMLG